MIESLKAVFAFGLLLYLNSLLYVLPTYYRRLNHLISRLRDNHPEVYSRLGEPSLSMMKMNIRSPLNLVTFVFRRQYVSLGDNTASEVGDAARWRLIYGMLPVLIPIVGIIVVTARILP